jgi:GxxExxY protein
LELHAVSNLIDEELTKRVIGAAIEVHRVLGPGLMESAYQVCLAKELADLGVVFQREVALPVQYKGVQLDCGYRLDFVVEKRLVLEIKSVEKIEPVHEAQLLTYMKLGRFPLGLLLNFNARLLKDGMIRRVL